MDDEDGRCLLDVICDPQALNDFLHGSETHLDADDLLDCSADPSSSFFSSAGGHVPEVQASNQLSASVPAEVPSGSVDLDFLEDDDILGGSPSAGGTGGTIGTSNEPCDILQQSLAEANITEQSLQAEAELDLGSFGLSGLTQVVQTLPDPGLPGVGAAAVGMGIGVGLGGANHIFSGPSSSSTATPPSATPDIIGPVLAHPGLQLQSQGMNKTISVQPFMQQVGLGNVTLQPISSLQALPNGSQSGQLGIGQIQVVGQPTVMAINQSGQPILTKTIGGYQLQQPGPEAGIACTQAGLGSVLNSAAGGSLLIQGGKTPLGSPALNVNGAGVGASSPSVSSSASGGSSAGGALTTSAGLVGFGGAAISTGVAAPQKPLNQGPVVQNVVIQRTPTPIQPKPPQGGVIQPRLFKQQQQQLSAPSSLQNDSSKASGVQQGQVPVSAGQNVAFLTGKPSANVVLSAPAAQGAPFPQALFKTQASQATGKPLSVHLLNQSGSIVIPSQAVLQGQNHQFLLPQLQAGRQILAQHPGGHIFTSQGAGGQLIANQILATNQNINLGQVLTSQGHSGTAHILSGNFQLQSGQMSQPTLIHVPVSLAQTQPQAQHGTTVIQGMPLQNSLAMLGQVDGLSPAVSLQPPPQQIIGGIPSNGSGAVATMQCQPAESVAVLASASEQAAQPAAPAPLLTVHTTVPVSTSVTASALSASPPSSSSSSSSSFPMALSQAGPQAQQSPGKLLLAPQGPGTILSQESLQMFLQQEPQPKAETASPPSGCVPASVIVSGSSAPPTSSHESLSAETWLGQNSAPSLSPSNTTAAVVYQISSTGHQHQAKVVGTCPLQPVAASAAPSSLGQTQSPQAAQPSPLVMSQQIQSPQAQAVPPAQPGPPSRSCTPSSLPPLFIIHNQMAGSSQPASQTPPQPQCQSRPPSQPVPCQLEAPPSSDSLDAPQAPPAQFQFVPAPAGVAVEAKQTAQLQVLTAEQQLQLVSAKLQALSAAGQSTAQQNQLLSRLQQVQQSIILKQQTQLQPAAQAQAQPQPQQPASNQFSPQQDAPTGQTGAPSMAGNPAKMASLLQPPTVLVKPAVTAPGELKPFSGPPGPAVATVKQGVTPVSLSPSVQSKPGVLGSLGGLSVGNTSLQMQLLGSGLAQLSVPHTPNPLQTQSTAVKMPFTMQPSKEARMLEQLRKQQGAVLHPDHSAPFRSFGDALHRLIPYHLYQGTPCSPEDSQKVDDEFETVSSELLKRTRAMLDKYRLLLYEESRRLGPSAEMVMIDRMFNMEEKTALSQDRLLAKERPEEYVVLQSTAAAQHSVPAESSTVQTTTPTPHPPHLPAAPTLSHITPTKLVIKQGGGSASVSWSTSTAPAAPTAPAPTPSRFSDDVDDADTLPERSKKPPIKTYEARRRVGLKLKIKQEAGLSKVVHNTALDPVHSQPRPPQHHPPDTQPSPQRHHQSKSVVSTATVNRTPTCSSDSSVSVTATVAVSSHHAGAASTTNTSLVMQVNGALEHCRKAGVQPDVSSAVPSTPCRLPLRKTYRENISPPARPGVVGGEPLRPQGYSSPAAQTVTASVKVENRGGANVPREYGPVGGAKVGGVALGGGAGGGAGGASARGSGGINTQVKTSTVGFVHELAEVEAVFNCRMKKNRLHAHVLCCSGEEEEEEEEEGEDGESRGSSSRERSSRADRQSLGPSSPAGSQGSWDSFVPSKRHKSDSPDMDNASFSSGSPPPDESLTEHLQSAIDSILNLQQGPAQENTGRSHGPHLSHPTAGTPVSPPGRRGTQADSGTDFSARGQNGKYASRTYSR